MNKNIIIGVIIVLVLLGGGYLLLKSNSTQAPSTQNANSTQPTAVVTSIQPTEQAASGNSVSYTTNGFQPSSITIKMGQTVTWTNKDSNPMWVASNPHPTHTDYPGFDALKEIPTNGTYSFTFTKIGTWGYHNHLNPSQHGTVIVTQ